MSVWEMVRRYRTLVLGFAALGVFTYCAVAIFGADPRALLGIAVACLLLVGLMAALGFLAAWVLRRFRR